MTVAGKKSAEPNALPETFEAALAELENLVARMESGDLPLEESLTAYQRGVLLRQFCDEKLKDAEQRISVLDGDTRKPFTPDGSPAQDP
jgi:exodeoxyribonuclease VII small subunit